MDLRQHFAAELDEAKEAKSLGLGRCISPTALWKTRSVIWKESLEVTDDSDGPIAIFKEVGF